MIKSLNNTLPPARKPLNRPLRGQDFLCTRREDLGVRLQIFGADELYQRVLVCLRGKIGVGRYNSISGRISPTFATCRQIDPENFGQGFQSVLRWEVPWARDPRLLVLDDGPHFRLERCAVGRLGLVDQADMCHIRCFKFNRQ